jgi:class 3 adenylate cyclase/tetratricopeptide (TPR) repeat protein
LTSAPARAILVEMLGGASSRSPAFQESQVLQPYVPRLVVDWLRETPSSRHRQLDGSLAFVDISGFTELTERLSRRGKVGAEEMNDVLGKCFGELLSVAYDYGAGVIKWGGDAVLLLFTGDSHAARACRGAFEMQKAIRSVGKLETSSGRVVLRMSVGIHSGPLEFFLVGDLHRELIITGPGATATVEMESMAAAGEVVISSTTAAMLEGRTVGEPRGLGFLLKRGPEVESERSAPVEDVTQVDLRACIPPEVSDHLLAGGGEAEHRPMTAAFIHFMRADEILTGEGPDVLADALEQCLGTVQRIAHEHRVTFFETDIAPSGGKIMLMAGAPRSAGNDEERMLRAMRAVVDAGGPLPVRIGVNWGRIFVGDFGPEYRRTYSVKGDAVNLAARLMARAEPGQVLATEDVLRRSRTAFDTVALEPFKAKGKSELVHAFEVGNVHGVRAARESETPLIGREQELGSLLTMLDLARDGRGCVVDLVAEPGMGKSRLIEELRRRAGEIRIVSAQCDEYELSTPYFSLRTVLSQLLDLAPEDEEAADRLMHVVGVVAPDLVPWVPLLGVPLGLELQDTPETAVLEEQFRRTRVDETTGQLLAALLPEPTLLVFEDTHWMDEASAGVLSQLLADVAERPWLVVTARRDEPTGFVPTGEAFTRLELAPLAAEQAEELVHAATEELPLLPHEIETLTARAGGNPFFLTQLLSAARAAGGVDELPDSLEAVMMAEIDRLPPSDRRLLRCAAVVGASFDPDLVAASLDEPPDADAWERLAQYVAPDDGDTGLRFRHALVRDAAYEGLPFRRRRELHERIGLALEERSDEAAVEAELLSLHFFSAGDHDRAWRYSQAAGERAQEIYANAEAATFFQRALEAARQLRDTSALDVRNTHERLGDVRVRLGELSQAATAYRASRRGLDDDPVQESRLLVKEAMVPFRLARYPAAIRWLNRALAVLEGVEGAEADVERVRIAVWCANTRQRQGRREDAIEWCERALAEAARTDADTRHAVGHAYVILDWAYFWLGRPDEAVYSPRALEIFEELGDLEWASIVLNNMGVFLYMQGRWDEALELERRALEAEETFGDRWGAALTTANIADILADQGRLDEAELLAAAAFRVYRATGISTDAAAGKSLLGRIEARSGRLDEARASFEEARAMYLESGQPDEALRADAGIAECLVLEGEASAAIALIDEIVAGASTDDLSVLESTLCRLRGCALLRLGRFDQARNELEEALRIVPQNDADFGMRSAAYEAALILDALVQLGHVSGIAALAEVAAARDEVVERLGVLRLPELPLPVPDAREQAAAASRA